MTRAICITNADLITPTKILRNTSIGVRNSTVTYIGKLKKMPRSVCVINAKGCFVAPGFIDTHIHGSPEAIFRNELKHGTTSMLVAISCDTLPNIYKKMDAAASFMKNDPLGPNLLGARVEGPYISQRKCGAQSARYIRPPNEQELSSIIRRCGPGLRMMSVAPEIKGAIPLIRMLKKRRIIASLGHSDASYHEALAGIDAGITHATHLFNAMRGIKSPAPGGAAAALLTDRRVTVEIIADMVHVDSARFALTMAVKGIDRTVIVTDSITAERPKGAWKEGGVYWLRKGVKAGSSIAMIKAVENAVKVCGLSLVDAVRLATIGPARLLGVEDKKGRIAPGRDADIVVFDRNFNVKLTMARGKIVYSR